MRVLNSPYPPHLVLSDFSIMAILVDPIYCLTVVLIFISLMTVMLDIFSCSYWPFMHLLWRNVSSNLLPILKLSYLSFHC